MSAAVALSSRMQWTNPDGTLTREAVTLLQNMLNRTGGAVYDIAANTVTFSPTGGLTATNVQQMGAELDSEKATVADLTAHTGNTSNPHSVTKAQVGLGNADNTSDANKPVSTAQAAADAAVQAFAINRANHTGTQTSGTIALASGSLGYAVGNGGTVTQLLSKSTNVTLNELSGEVTMNNAALAAGVITSFVMNNSTTQATDVVIRNHVSGGTLGAYGVEAVAGAGTITFYVRNNTAGSLSEAPVIRFAVVKAATS